MARRSDRQPPPATDPSQGGKRTAMPPAPEASQGGKRAAMPPAPEADGGFIPIAGLEDLDAPDDTGGSGAGAEAGDNARTAAPSLARGTAVLKRAVQTLPAAPGVYRMLDRRGEPLYVGKARSLKARVTSYTQPARQPHRIQRMVAETTRLEVIRTHTEVEALLLESNLVKRLMPRFNVQLRDDKSFPYIHVTGDPAFPRLRKHRGAQSQPGDYYGPFASAGAVNRTLAALEKAFLLRSCSDSVFNSRTRPCLKYHIKRCAAPCVGYVSAADYASLVAQARAFLAGRDPGIQQELAGAMEAAAERLDFETAALYRDRLRALAHIQSHQDVNVANLDEADVVALHQDAGQTCIQVFFFRAGRNYGNRSYFPGHDKSLAAEDVLAAFLAQFYDNKPVPRRLLLDRDPADKAVLAEALSARAGRRVTLEVPQRGDKRKLVANAADNAREALARHLAESDSQRRLLDGLAAQLGLPQAPARIEVYDNSHTRGSEPYGAMIVAGPEGFRKNQYRKFKIRKTRRPGEPAAEAPAEAAADSGAGTDTAETAPEGATDPPTRAAGGDDYAMLREVLERRFRRAIKEDPDNESGNWPDLVLVDGGRGQLNVALEVFAELGITDVALAGVAKGPDRDAGRERIFLPGQSPLLLERKDPVLYFIQRLRDEAHRFVIGSHRAGRSKARTQSTLDAVPGIGAKRKKALLLHFGSAKAVARAALADLEAVPGISRAVAQRIYDHFQGAP